MKTTTITKITNETPILTIGDPITKDDICNIRKDIQDTMTVALINAKYGRSEIVDMKIEWVEHTDKICSVDLDQGFFRIEITNEENR